MTSSAHWWERAFLVGRVDASSVGLLNRSLRDSVIDVGLVAAERFAGGGITLVRPTRDINRAAQRVLKTAGMIGRIHGADDPISDLVAEALGKALRDIRWRRILGTQFRSLVPKVVRWHAYATSDPAAWVNLTDTLNDILLARLYRHDPALGSYVLGNIGGVLEAPTGRLATTYPRFYEAARTAHKLRLESELSHAQVRKTKKATRRIEFDELPTVQRKLGEAYLEIWSKW